ncbi:pinin/SDK/memA/ protein conserved region-domain-containing protein [Dipodascopsis tothii]|uniref:pinin/SDK/memA/ protein conserved region-domain-containing protein n=1 Tax=Dipodascopsis tothii TaxID=44089 RepID=UPI0034CF41FC
MTASSPEGEPEAGPRAIASAVVAPESSKRRTASPEAGSKRARADGGDRGRNKRMFGALLSSLGQFDRQSRQSSSAAARRAELEAKVRAQQDAERAELERSLATQAEQQSAEEQAVRARRQDEIAAAARARAAQVAGFLRTRTEPALYYMPARLSAAQEDAIEAQQAAAASASRSASRGSSARDRSRSASARPAGPADGDEVDE